MTRSSRYGAPLIVALSLTVALAGCQRLGYGSRSAPLPATPTAPVASQSLEPLQPMSPTLGPDGQPIQGAPLDGTQTNVAAVDPSAGTAPSGPPAGAREIGRSDMLGGWSIASGADNCKLFMTLTTWSGGYRANSRGCASPQMQTISAWDLQGKQVLLKDASGATVAELYATGAENFAGRTTAGAPIQVYR
ncbi:AprI/Inh family metalloprotease inhibitor [Stappia indica]|uniref:AprI/Inh family metalloprotease inhibitor n=1 Tax=Stappia indica TaxID=538381 RepID=A0A857CA52_9HYPH|nr:AprI/Inh family metalloprotease inhibitor [Stappia indica]QGZ35759.1 AprI/Inh family metalloprotease inhibitor [Stappia indica]